MVSFLHFVYILLSFSTATGKKKKVKGKTLNLNEFLADDVSGAATTVTVTKSWADEMESNEFDGRWRPALIWVESRGLGEHMGWVNTWGIGETLVGIRALETRVREGCVCRAFEKAQVGGLLIPAGQKSWNRMSDMYTQPQLLIP